VNVYVFVGPTLNGADARAELEAVYLPPVAQGDVYRVACHNPVAIGIIDGYFQRVPAVWHKEILWAMTRGIHVFGAASMGALRAAELASFGMEGVGKIFEAYRDGILNDDDEVAVRHGPAEAGFRASSEAMVNIRATVAASEASGVISQTTRETLERTAKEQFYPNRIYPAIVQRAADCGASEEELTAFVGWLVNGRIDQKRDDALAMLKRMRTFLASSPKPKPVEFRLEDTLQWQRATRFAGVLNLEPGSTAENVRLEALVDELGLDGDNYPDAYQLTLLSHLALTEAQARGYEADEPEVAAMRSYFRQSKGLQENNDMTRWLEENHLTEERFEALLREETLRTRVFEKLEVEIFSQLPDHLRLTGQYSKLLVRAQRKKGLLEAWGMENANLGSLGLSEAELFQWYFGRLGRPTPNNIEEYARARGFGAPNIFLRALLREYCYIRVMEMRRAAAVLGADVAEKKQG
jgi:hypothetical protein